MKKEGLSITNRIALISAFGVLFLGVVIQIGIAQWNKPDIRYEEGSYYHTGSLSITSLRVINYGHSDAENIDITVYFPFEIKDFAAGDPAINITTRSGGIGEQFAVLSIDRIVPEQTVFIYFAGDRITNLSGISNQGVVSQITYNGGIGKTGLPIYLDEKFFLVIVAVYLVGSLFLSIYALRKVTEFQKRTTEIKEAFAQISDELALLEKTTEAIDNAILDAKKSGIKLPENVDEAQKKVKEALYGSRSLSE
jgi:hypothetical protein